MRIVLKKSGDHDIIKEKNPENTPLPINISKKPESHTIKRNSPGRLPVSVKVSSPGVLALIM